MEYHLKPMHLYGLAFQIKEDTTRCFFYLCDLSRILPGGFKHRAGTRHKIRSNMEVKRAVNYIKHIFI